MTGSPDALHAATEDAFNRGDVDALVALYADDACLVEPDGSVARGAAEIRRVWGDFVGLGGRIRMSTRYCVEQGDLALMSNVWRFTSDALSFDSASAEVAKRGPDGRWQYLVDHPTGGVQAS